MVAAVAGAASIGIGLAAWLWPQSPESVLAACRKDHPDATGEPGPPMSDRPPQAVEVRQISGCVDPDTPGAESDGLWSVDVVTYEIPGTSLADQFTGAQVFDTACDALSVGYQFDNQGRTERLDHNARVGQVISVHSGESELFPAELSDDVWAARKDHLVVLTHGRYTLVQVDCITRTSSE